MDGRKVFWMLTEDGTDKGAQKVRERCKKKIAPKRRYMMKGRLHWKDFLGKMTLERCQRKMGLNRWHRKKGR